MAENRHGKPTKLRKLTEPVKVVVQREPGKPGPAPSDPEFFTRKLQDRSKYLPGCGKR
jgi:hypothetical protein